MADILTTPDNSANVTTRLITATAGLQTFTNTATDTSFSLGTGDTDDYFKLTVSKSSNIIFSLSSQTGNANIALLDSSGNPTDGILNSSSNTGFHDAFVAENVAAGTYYVRVYIDTPPATNNPSATTYTLGINTLDSGAGSTDILWRDTSTGRQAIWRMNGTTSIGTQGVNKSVKLPWQLVDTADVNGDGNLDFFWRRSDTGANAYWLMDANGGYISSLSLPTVRGRDVGGTADLSGDGKPDLVWRDVNSRGAIIWVMNGNILQRSATVSGAMDSAWRIEELADLNNDGQTDIIWRNPSDGTHRVWYMNGLEKLSEASFTGRTNGGSGATKQNWQIAGAGDFNGDGKTDLLWQDLTNGTRNVWFMNNQTRLSTGTLTTSSNPGKSYVIADALPKAAVLPDLAGNTIRTAFDIGTLNIAGTSDVKNASYVDRVGGPDSEDYYRFTLSSAASISLALDGLQANADLWLIRDTDNNGVISSDDEVLARSELTGTSRDTITNRDLNAGTYFIRVRPTAGTSTPYQLGITARESTSLDLQAISVSLTRRNGSALPSTTNVTNSSQRDLRVNYTVRYSNGEANATAQTLRLAFYISRDPTITSSDQRLDLNDDNFVDTQDYVTTSSLAPNTSFSGIQNIRLPNSTSQWWASDQTYYIGVLVDPENTVFEPNETNNGTSASNGSISITGIPRPDLVGDGLDIVQTSGQPNGTLRLTGAVRNRGSAATNSNFSVWFYLSSDNILNDDGSDYFLGRAVMPIMNANTRVTFDSNITDPNQSSYFPSSIVLPTQNDWTGWQGNGRYYILMWVDRSGLVTNESLGGRENNLNNGNDLDFIDITGLA